MPFKKIYAAGLFTCTLLLCGAAACHSPVQHAGALTPPPAPQNDTLACTLLFAGDLMNHGPQIKAAYDYASGQYHYDTCYYYLAPLIRSADVAIANLEVTLGGAPFTGYPMFSAPDAYATAVKNAGFDLLETANNHSCDRNKKGVVRTLDVLDSLNIVHTGSFRNKQERDSLYPLLYEKNGIRFCLLNATYGTNGLPVPEPTVVNLLDSVQLKQDFAKACQSGADLIIMTVHWGLEYQRTPSAEQKKWADFFIREGAGLIIGAHPHVVQTYELREAYGRKVPVFYSLGNFISNQRERYKDGGIMARIRVTKAAGVTQVARVEYTPVWVHKQMSPKVVYRLIPADFKADSIFTPGEKLLYKTFMEDTRKHLQNLPAF